MSPLHLESTALRSQAQDQASEPIFSDSWQTRVDSQMVWIYVKISGQPTIGERKTNQTVEIYIDDYRCLFVSCLAEPLQQLLEDLMAPFRGNGGVPF